MLTILILLLMTKKLLSAEKIILELVVAYGVMSPELPGLELHKVGCHYPTVKRWQAKSQDPALIWVTKNPHFIAVKLWFELTYNICAVSIFGYSAIQLLRKKNL